ncbi:acetolactate decarboxylase [Streptococcus catagoni]|uniref:acetolactate decarboxylase n=1 Tax=Streptococcus catagoni TaxID=2654874 RepID=UPI0014085BC5|nr:acetolactate decarboxylase [Streptococcus catagoni]
MTNQTTLFQHNTLASLMAGLYKGTVSIEDLLKHGDLGIGTLDYIDGELIILDGKAYQARALKDQVQVLEVDPKELVPYAAIVSHRVDSSFRIDQAISDSNLKEKLLTYFKSKNLFQSIKITGKFENMHVRMIPKSQAGKSFAEIASQQPEFTEATVCGTLVGFWTPELFHGVSVAGYHLHFLSEDHSFGGHVMDFRLVEGQVEIGQIDSLQQDFPSQNSDFLEADFDVKKLMEDITKSE